MQIVYKYLKVRVGLKEAIIISDAIKNLEGKKKYERNVTNRSTQNRIDKSRHDDNHIVQNNVESLNNSFHIIRYALDEPILNLIGDGTRPNQGQILRLHKKACRIIFEALKIWKDENKYPVLEENMQDPNPTPYKQDVPELLSYWEIISKAADLQKLEGISYD